MKKALIILAIGSVLWACQKSPQDQDTTSIIGKVSPVADGYITLSYGGILDSSKISKEGDFKIQTSIRGAGSGIVLFNNKFANIYLESGKNLNLGINPLTFPEDLTFEGELGAVNNYLRLAGKLEKNTAIPQEELFVLEPEKFISLSDSILELKLQLLKEYVIRYPELDSTFIKTHKTDIKYAWATQRLLYPGYYALLRGKIADLPKDYHNSYLKDLDINNSSLLYSSVYQGFLEDYLDYRQVVYLQNNPQVEKLWYPESVARFRVIQQEFTDTLVKDFVLFSSMSDHLDNFGTDHLETFLTNFQLNCHNEDFKNLIDQKISKLKTLERGNPAPEFTALNSEKKTVSLSDYKGSLIYINLWATWSPWSLQEFPYWESLVRKFEDRGVRFISISMDFIKDLNNWKYVIENKNLQGIHLIQDPESRIWYDQYFINDLPRYMLIDQDGNIISVHAPRPSENMEEVLERLIK
jgi:peroxiredoxin